MEHSENQEVLGEQKAKEIGKLYVQQQHYGAEVAFQKVVLERDQVPPTYHLEGTVSMRTRSIVAAFLYPRANKFSLQVRIHALEGKVLHYELR